VLKKELVQKGRVSNLAIVGSTSKKIFIQKDYPNLDHVSELSDDFLCHMLLDGVSRSGKSTLLAGIVLRFIEKGYTVLWREVGKFDLLRRFQNKQDIIDHLVSIKASKKRIQFWKKYKGNPFVIKNDDNLERNKINIFCFDLVSKSIQGLILQYYELLRRIRMDRELNWFTKGDLAIFIDEANDIYPSPAKLPSKGVFNFISEMAYWMRQWAGYHVKKVITTHKLTQLNSDVRGQCSLRLFKALDVKDRNIVMKEDLFELGGDEWADAFVKLKNIKTMVDKVLYIDLEGVWGFIPVTYIPKIYTPQQCRDFIRDSDIEIKEIIESNEWLRAIAMAEEIYPKIKERPLMWLFEEKENGWIIYANIKQIEHFILTKKEYSWLVHQTRTLNIVLKNLARMKELDYNNENDAPQTEEDKRLEEEARWERLTEIADSDVTNTDKVYDIISEYVNTTGKELEALLEIEAKEALYLIKVTKIKLARKRRKIKKRKKATGVNTLETKEETSSILICKLCKKEIPNEAQMFTHLIFAHEIDKKTPIAKLGEYVKEKGVVS
jgi:hypothetical protein